MMQNYTIVTLDGLLKVFSSEEKIDQILNAFSCVNNKDVDRFLKEKAVLFDKQGLSKTYLVYTSYKNEMVLVGYFTLANKSFVVKKNNGISKTLMKRISKFGQYDDELKQYMISSPLIAQLGKNEEYKGLISGDVLLSYACDTVKQAQALLGGKIVYLECEDKIRLLEFYRNNGFVDFGKRELEVDEKDDMEGKYLIQLLKYLH